LEKARGEQAAVNDGAAQGDAKTGGAVNAPVPDAAAEPVEVFRMPPREHSLGLAVAALLFEVGGDGGTAAVPDETAGTKSNLPVALLQPPA
jgi:hypothetical protein